VRILNTNLDEISIEQQGNKMGMCPQFNTIWGPISVDQCLEYIGQIKGLEPAELQFQKEFIKKTLDLEQYSKTLS